MKEKIFIKHDIIRNPNLSISAKLAYLSLRYKILDKIQLINNKHDILELFCVDTYNSKEMKKLQTTIKKGLQELHINNYITINKTIDNEVYEIDSTNIWIDKNETGFSIINVEPLKKLAMENTLVDNAKIIIYYCTLVDTINNKTKYGFTSIRTFCEYTGFSSKTIIKYNSFLFDYDFIIFFKLDNQTRQQNGQIKSECLKYCLPEDESIVLPQIDRRGDLIEANNLVNYYNRQRTLLKQGEIKNE